MLESIGDSPDNAVTTHYEGPPGQIVGISIRRLTRLATRHGTRVTLLLRTGDAIPTGAPLALIDGPIVDARALSRCLLVRRERSLQYAPLYALRILTDVSLRALSPGLNDPRTATRSQDEVEGVLRTAAPLPLGPVSITGEGSELVLPLPSWSDVVDLALMEIMQCSIGQPQITRRLVALLNDLLAV